MGARKSKCIMSVSTSNIRDVCFRTQYKITTSHVTCQILHTKKESTAKKEIKTLPSLSPYSPPYLPSQWPFHSAPDGSVTRPDYEFRNTFQAMLHVILQNVTCNVVAKTVRMFQCYRILHECYRLRFSLKKIVRLRKS